jgi:HprK-related kinase B
MNWLQQHDWLICHAAGLDFDGIGIGMAGLSGGGKSTLMLGLMDQVDVRYVTNDRLFIRREADRVQARGIPKLPRINPGTIVHNPALHGLIGESRRAELLAMPSQELWHLEEKHDVMISEIYGDDRIEEEMLLHGFLVLNWSHDTEQETRLEAVDLDAREDLLPAIMKSPGPFMQYSDGAMYRDSQPLDSQKYLQALNGVTILEASGRVDIPLLQRELSRWARDY